ncbi:MAG: 3-deoxy-8-phosphooctulonate synthase [Bacteroidales bacterium]|nr:3-deoxy-8-phosphooctulonate synthase [Bacteroidales bacterium]MCK9498516.1 3-deoxy-8-phosphooctulonate synthase [Bacteroidales bacterium]MDY0314261.1 3-deoxy-8-phosphooctulonate synthase [Bacteroidales bacterium]NLB86035.1 3-deoxy-8-phosphooctulonate synthase [Bacteroidales bacterium]
MENLILDNSAHFFLIAGPCVVENEEITLHTAKVLKDLCKKHNIQLIFKSSYRKANRSSLSSFTSLGDEKALEILSKVKQELNLHICTDIHSPEEAEIAAQLADIVQIPAFLCRQTDLLLAAGKTGRFVNIKKGQFLSPDSMKFAAEKILSTGNKNIMLCERGTTFGYQDLVIDFRSIPIMKTFGYPVVLDVTHSLQQPNQTSGVTGGQPEMIEHMAKAGLVVGADGLFIETHPEPKNALSDGANMLKLSLLDGLLEKLVRIKKAIV